MKFKSLLFLSTLILLSIEVNAQTNDLTTEELESFKVQCQERIDAFQMGLEIIADKKQDPSIRRHYINTLPEMFIGGGEPWTDADGARHNAVKMQIAVIRKDGKVETKNRALKDYLNNLQYIKGTVEITKAKTCLISNFYKKSDNLYVATATFFQYYKLTSGESNIYRDFTQKNVAIYLSKVEDGQLGTYWDLKFGDIEVSEIQKTDNI